MERLTNKNNTLNYSENNAISLKSEKVGLKRLNFYTGKPIDKLAEYENFMEENGFESLEDVKRLLETISVALGDTNSERIRLREDYKLISKFNEEYKQEIKQLKHDLAVRDKALELAIKEIAILNNNNVCANKQCSDTSCDYYTETHNCLNMRKKYWLEQAEKELKGESNDD